jgi:hypothetical protein
MDMKTFLRQATPAERERLASAVGSSVGYLYLIGGSHRRPGPKLCKALAAAEPKLTLHELRPDIWMPPTNLRRSTDLGGELRRSGGRQPASPAQVFDTVPGRAVVVGKFEGSDDH